MPIAIARLRALIDLAGSDGVDGIDLVEDGTHVRITRNGAGARRPVVTARPATAAVAAPAQDIFAAPMFGVFHLTPAPGALPFVAVGDTLTPGQQLCLIEAMKMFSAVHCDRSGRLDAILAEPGTEVTGGQPLFRISRA